MKKKYTTEEYKIKHKRKINSKIVKERKKKRKKKIYNPSILFNYHKNYKLDPTLPVYPPDDFRLLENTERCLHFFREIRSSANFLKSNGKKIVIISLKDVKQIDYATISVLTSISDDLKSKNIGLQGDFPIDPDCKKYIIESGFLSHMVDNRNRKFKDFGKSKLIFFEKGSGKLSRQDSKKITELIKDSVEHLTGNRQNIRTLKSIILEVCGNSIEHSKTKCQLWLLGVKFTEDKIYFTVTDVGKGILETLFIHYFTLMKDLIKFKSKKEILEGAFVQKYGSSTKEINRNKGLPSVKECYDKGIIKNLFVLTNNVLLSFENESKSKVISPGLPRFRGTIFQWEITKDTIINSIECVYDS